MAELQSVVPPPVDEEYGHPPGQLEALVQQQAGTAMGIEWRDLTFKLGEWPILSHVSGMLRPGRLTAVLGPSGSGKTTLLNVISGRQKTYGRSTTASRAHVSLTGEVFSNGTPVHPSFFSGKTAYVFQDNALYETETPRECLNFSAFLRLPTSVSAKQRKALVDNLLDKLRLESCADLMVGGPLRKGLSGGEQKRTAVGIELIAEPHLLFLDEPLSGLDAYNAFTLVEILKHLAQSGVPVMMSVHQPSSEIFDQFDDVMILHQGQVVFFGESEKVAEYFHTLGFACPPNFNPADHVMSVIQQESPESMVGIWDKWYKSEEHHTLQVKIETLKVIASRVHPEGHNQGPQPLLDKSGEVQAPVIEHHRNCVQGLLCLLARDWRRHQRDWFILVSGLITQSLVGLAYGWLFIHAGINEDNVTHKPNVRNCNPQNFSAQDCQTKFQVHFNVLSMISITMMLTSVSLAVGVFQAERSCFLRERAGGYYTVMPFFLSKSLYEVATMGLFSAAAVLPPYYMVGLRGNVAVLVLETLLLSTCSSSIMYAVSAAVSTKELAYQLAVIPQTLMFMCSGVVIPISLIPSSLRWVKWICPLYYGIGLLGSSEFEFLYEEQEKLRADPALAYCESPLSMGLPECGGYQLRMAALKIWGVERESFWWPNLTLLMGLLIAFRLLAAAILWRKSRYVL